MFFERQSCFAHYTTRIIELPHPGVSGSNNSRQLLSIELQRCISSTKPVHLNASRCIGWLRLVHLNALRCIGWLRLVHLNALRCIGWLQLLHLNALGYISWLQPLHLVSHRCINSKKVINTKHETPHHPATAAATAAFTAAAAATILFLSFNACNKGVYLFRITGGGKIISTGKFVKM